MKRNKWFIIAALVGLVLSVGFLVTSCQLLEELLGGGCKGGNCNSSSMSSGCSGADFSGCSSGIGSGCSSGMSGMNCSGLGSGMNCSGASCR